MKHLTKITDIKVDIKKLKSVYFNTIDKILEWSKDDPNLYDFNAICVNQIPNDPLSIRGGNIRGLYWTYPKENWEEEKRLNKVDETQYTELCKPFKGTYVEEVLNSFKSPYTRVRFIVQKPGAYILPHMDYDTRYSIRFFIPLVVNDWSWVAIQRKGEKLPEFKYMPADGSVWFVNVGHRHSAFNFGKTDSIKFIVSINGQEDLDVLQ